MRGLIRLIASMFYRPPLLQVAALCLRGVGHQTHVLLIRSLDSNRWILPKGWPMNGKTLAEAAEIEAWEEAGVKGAVNPQAIGIFSTKKRRGSGLRQNSDVHVFELRVTLESQDYPESEQRKARWFSMTEAIDRLREPELRTLIQRHLLQDH